MTRKAVINITCTFDRSSKNIPNLYVLTLCSSFSLIVFSIGHIINRFRISHRESQGLEFAIYKYLKKIMWNKRLLGVTDECENVISSDMPKS